MVGGAFNGGASPSASGRAVSRRRGPRRGISFLVVALVAVLVPLVATSGASANAPRSFFGVVPWLSFQGADFQRLEQAKVRNARTPFYWPSIEPAHRDFRWSATDQFVGSLALHHVRVLPFLNGSPSWVAGDPRKPPLKSKAARKHWKQFVKACVKRYGRHGEYWREHPTIPKVPITTWQIWNEQNNPSYFAPKPKPKAYAKLVRLAARAARSKDHKAKIVLGGMAGDPDPDHSMTSWRFLGKLYKSKGIRKSFNTVAVHPYSPTVKGVRHQVVKLRKTMDHHGDKKASIYITEMGWGSAAPNPKWPLLKGTDGQVQMLKKSYHVLLRNRKAWHLKRVYWFLWRDAAPDSAVNCSFCKSAGLFKSDYTPKPSWKAFRHITARAGHHHHHHG